MHIYYFLVSVAAMVAVPRDEHTHPGHDYHLLLRVSLQDGALGCNAQHKGVLAEAEPAHTTQHIVSQTPTIRANFCLKLVNNVNNLIQSDLHFTHWFVKLV